MAKRKAGKPPKDKRVITPELLLIINKLYLQNVPLDHIAAVVGCAKSTIHYHIETKIRPIWRQVAASDKETQVAKINHLERVAWEQFERDAPAETSEQIKRGLIGSGKGRQRLGVIERAIKTIKRHGQKAWLEVVQWCIAEKNRLEGHYRAADEFGDAEALQVIPIEVTTREDVQRLAGMRLSFTNGVIDAQAVEPTPSNGNGHANGHPAEGDDDDDD